jgi:quinol monooxygenase YgiN
MPVKPWVTYRRAEPNRDYVALLSELPVKRFRTLPEILLYTWRIGAQLRRSSGLIGYSLLARPLQKKFWTLSVWEDNAALMKFVNQSPHSDVMTALKGKMEETRFVQWKLLGSEYPPGWRDALKRGAP